MAPLTYPRAPAADKPLGVPQERNDPIAFALAEGSSGCILLSGDDVLRTLAVEHEIEVHGVLWVLDQLHQKRLASAPTIVAVLCMFAEDASVRLPRRELAAYIKKYEGLG